MNDNVISKKSRGYSTLNIIEISSLKQSRLEMDIKLVENPIWKKSAIIWFVFAAIQFWGFGLYSSIFFMISGILGMVQGILLLTRITKVTYLTLQNEILTIHLRKLPLGKKRIKYTDIILVELIGMEITLYLKGDKRAKIKKNWISYNDFSKLKKELEEHSITIL